MLNISKCSFFNCLILAVIIFSSFFTAANAAGNQEQIIEQLKTLPDDQLKSFRDEEGNTALHLALKYNNNNFAEAILTKYPNLVNIENAKQESPIYIADTCRNIDGVKLCLEFHPEQGNANNNCPQIFEKVRGTNSYYLSKNMFKFFQPEGGENKDKLVIVLRLPDIFAHSTAADGSDLFYNDDNHYFEHFKNSKVPVLMIGNGKHSLSFQLIQESIERIKLPEKIMFIIDGHGGIDQEGNHVTSFDNTQYKVKTKDLFTALKSIYKDKPIEVFLTSCHGGGAIKDVDLLPKGSTLLVLSQADKQVLIYDSRAIIDRPENYQDHPERFSLRYFLKTLRIPMKSINHSDSNRSMIPVQTDQ
ncbi:exported hypothetical protein [Gammaproteobacteria bacterium]